MPKTLTPRTEGLPADYVVTLNHPLITSAVVGDMVTLPDMSTRRTRRWIVARCASETTLMLACLSCRQPLATVQQVWFHLEMHPEQTHVLARQCGEHGWETLHE